MEHKIEINDLTKLIEQYKLSLSKVTEEAMVYKVLADKYFNEIQALKSKIEALEKPVDDKK